MVWPSGAIADYGEGYIYDQDPKTAGKGKTITAYFEGSITFARIVILVSSAPMQDIDVSVYWITEEMYRVTVATADLVDNYFEIETPPTVYGNSIVLRSKVAISVSELYVQTSHAVLIGIGT